MFVETCNDFGACYSKTAGRVWNSECFVAVLFSAFAFLACPLNADKKEIQVEMLNFGTGA